MSSTSAQWPPYAEQVAPPGSLQVVLSAHGADATDEAGTDGSAVFPLAEVAESCAAPAVGRASSAAKISPGGAVDTRGCHRSAVREGSLRARFDNVEVRVVAQRAYIFES
eukprot:4199736-Prymnesium_polylepis.1